MKSFVHHYSHKNMKQKDLNHCGLSPFVFTSKYYKAMNYTGFAVDSHPAVLDGFINQTRRAFAQVKPSVQKQLETVPKDSKTIKALQDKGAK